MREPACDRLLNCVAKCSSFSIEEAPLGIFGWLERKVFLGDVIKDYGVLDERKVGIRRLRTSVVLCRRKGQLKLAIRTAETSLLSASVNYAMVDATPSALSKLSEILKDAQSEISAILPNG